MGVGYTIFTVTLHEKPIILTEGNEESRSEAETAEGNDPEPSTANIPPTTKLS